MRHLSLITATACAGLMFGTIVYAQQPAPPPAPPGYGAPITLAQANTAIAAGEAEMKKNGWNMVLSVVGPGGQLVALQKSDLAPNISVDVAPDKARMSALFRTPTKAYQDRVAAGETFLLGIRGVVPAAGGIPIIVGGKVIGAFGVSGGSPMQDHQVAQAAVDAVK